MSMGRIWGKLFKSKASFKPLIGYVVIAQRADREIGRAFVESRTETDAQAIGIKTLSEKHHLRLLDTTIVFRIEKVSSDADKFEHSLRYNLETPESASHPIAEARPSTNAIISSDSEEMPNILIPPSKPERRSADERLRATLLSWAMREIAPWKFNPITRTEAEDTFEKMNCSRHGGFVLFDFNGGAVSIRPKPASAEPSPAVKIRSELYLSFFCDVARLLPTTFRVTLCMGLEDYLINEHDVPIFCFQKKGAARSLLLPDIDFLHYNFYEASDFADHRRYSEKSSTAVFAGSTTGGTITLSVARSLSSPRLRAAGFFMGNPRVDFRLPAIVQHATAEVRAYLETQQFCRQAPLTWNEQFQNKFLISMDGNGAACSRVLVSLLSNSVLLKYDSPCRLYYFSDMMPWRHYVPISEDSEVDKIIDMEARFPERFEAIAASGREFANYYLSRSATQIYTAILLELYAESFKDGQWKYVAEKPPAAALQALRVISPKLIAHIEGYGDTISDSAGWAGIRGSGRSIEGFSIHLDRSVPSSGVSYQSVLADGTLSERVALGDYCGTRGLSQPIFGFSIYVEDSCSALFEVAYEANFVDGSHVAPARAPTVCRSRSSAPLEAFRVHLRSIMPNSL